MIAVITRAAGAAPSMHASRAPPTKCPLVPIPTGKLIICAANTNAPMTPNSGIRDSSNSCPARRDISTTAGILTASSEAQTGVDRKLSGICIAADALTVSRLFKACHTLPILFDTLGLDEFGARSATRAYRLWRPAPVQTGDFRGARYESARFHAQLRARPRNFRGMHRAAR